MRFLSQEEVLEIYQKAGAIWFFDPNGDPTAPHAELTTGERHSDGYVDSQLVFCDPPTSELLADQMAMRLQGLPVSVLKVDWVVGSSYQAITASYELAGRLGAKHGFTKKDPKDPKKQVWMGPDIPEGANVLQCEELITTMGTTEQVHRAICEGNPHPVSFYGQVVTGVYRPDNLTAPGSERVIALISRQVRSWAKDECPLCKQGSPAIRPRGRMAELTGQK